MKTNIVEKVGPNCGKLTEFLIMSGNKEIKQKNAAGRSMKLKPELQTGSVVAVTSASKQKSSAKPKKTGAAAI